SCPWKMRAKPSSNAARVFPRPSRSRSRRPERKLIGEVARAPSRSEPLGRGLWAARVDGRGQEILTVSLGRFDEAGHDPAPGRDHVHDPPGPGPMTTQIGTEVVHSAHGVNSTRSLAYGPSHE